MQYNHLNVFPTFPLSPAEGCPWDTYMFRIIQDGARLDNEHFVKRRGDCELLFERSWVAGSWLNDITHSIAC